MSNFAIHSAMSLPQASGASAPKRKLQEIASEIDSRFTLHPSVEELLLDMADNFIDQVTSSASKLAKHRRSTIIEAQDIQFCLEKHWGIQVPGTGTAANVRKTQFANSTKKGSTHYNRLEMKKKALQERQPLKKSSNLSSKKQKKSALAKQKKAEASNAPAKSAAATKAIESQ